MYKVLWVVIIIYCWYCLVSLHSTRQYWKLERRINILITNKEALKDPGSDWDFTYVGVTILTPEVVLLIYTKHTFGPCKTKTRWWYLVQKFVLVSTCTLSHWNQIKSSLHILETPVQGRQRLIHTGESGYRNASHLLPAHLLSYTTDDPGQS